MSQESYRAPFLGGLAFLALVALYSILVLLRFDPGQEPNVLPSSGETSDGIVTIEVMGGEMLGSTEGSVTERLRFARAYQNVDGTLLLEGVDAVLQSAGEERIQLRAGMGRFNPATKDLHLSGGVHAASGESRRFYAPEARYAAGERMLYATGTAKDMVLYHDNGVWLKALTLKTDDRFDKIDVTQGTIATDIDLPMYEAPEDENPHE